MYDALVGTATPAELNRTSTFEYTRTYLRVYQITVQSNQKVRRKIFVYFLLRIKFISTS